MADAESMAVAVAVKPEVAVEIFVTVRVAGGGSLSPVACGDSVVGGGASDGGGGGAGCDARGVGRRASSCSDLDRDAGKESVAADDSSAQSGAMDVAPGATSAGGGSLRSGTAGLGGGRGRWIPPRQIEVTVFEHDWRDAAVDIGTASGDPVEDPEKALHCWPASFAMCSQLPQIIDEVVRDGWFDATSNGKRTSGVEDVGPGKTQRGGPVVVEFGCGCALPSLVAAQYHPGVRAMATDHVDGVRTLVDMSAAGNDTAARVAFCKVDWSDWSDVVAQPVPDIVLCSDLLYDGVDIEGLFAAIALARLANRRCRVFFAYHARSSVKTLAPSLKRWKFQLQLVEPEGRCKVMLTRDDGLTWMDPDSVGSTEVSVFQLVSVGDGEGSAA